MDMEIPKDEDIEMEEKVELTGRMDKLTEHIIWGAQGFMDIPMQGKT